MLYRKAINLHLLILFYSPLSLMFTLYPLLFSYTVLHLAKLFCFHLFQGDIFSGLNDGLLSRAEALAAVDMQKHQSSHAAHQQMTQQLKVNKLSIIHSRLLKMKNEMWKFCDFFLLCRWKFFDKRILICIPRFFFSYMHNVFVP